MFLQQVMFRVKPSRNMLRLKQVFDMKAKRTVRVKLHHLTNIKEKLLEREYEAFQEAVKGKNSQLYSATKQQARRVVIQNNPKNKQPIRLRNDVIKLEEQDYGDFQLLGENSCL
ncbi:MAG: hypothetical protein BTN85_2106 [Candidatus Methanohalarchaeum thermophilum]|uniref:Uncharacterized protein n=1 Tax=Methanohalarchaeum thermophilum TaxID=1903181 RepID=A0A1Q6DSV4_METT1|nr:MAG: hypothetical protein BTN85_2106 [Candidatus Methanohalarchaeum thermophilum]